MMERQEIIARNPLVPFLEARGITLRLIGGKLTTNRCGAIEHKPGHQCVSVDREKDLWFCNDCKLGGSVIDFTMAFDGIDKGAAMAKLAGEINAPPARLSHAPAPPKPATAGGPGRIVKTYDYTDEGGKLLFQVCRMEPKDFRQRAPVGDKWRWFLGDGWGVPSGTVWLKAKSDEPGAVHFDEVRRVLYNLPKIAKADCVFICEGEKDADTLNALGWAATTSCGGAKKWDASYTPFLRAKDLVILPDNDKSGSEHRDLLKEQLAKVARSIRIIEMPEGLKDVTELFESFATLSDAKNALLDMCEQATVLYRGESVPVQTMDELEEEYRAHVKRAATHQLNLGNWLPAMRAAVRPLVPGEMFTILAGTGCGKTMFLQNICRHTNLETLFFETELPGTLSFERFAAMDTNNTAQFVEKAYKEGNSVDWRKTGRLSHIVCCHKSKVTPEEIERIINATELKTSRRPVLVLVDYIQLIKSSGKSRYEITSDVAEQLKIVAKNTGTIIGIASQIGRPSTDKGKKKETAREVSLTDGKDSGSIENSSGLVIGGWRDEGDKDRLWLKVLKNTKGVSGLTFACRINQSLQIEQETT